MNRLLGYSLMSVGLVGFIFFLIYKGTAISVKELWLVLSISVIVAGAYFLAKHKLKKLKSQAVDNNRVAQIDQLKRKGDKVKVTIDNAEVKTRSYQKEIVSNSFPSRIEMLDALYDSNRNYKTEEIQQTYIVFYKQYNGDTYKFVSQATSQNSDAVKRYIDNQKGIDLFIDPKNPANYYFELPYL